MNAVPSRRSVLAAFGLGAVGLGLAGCGDRATATAATSFPEIPLRVGTRWSARPAGALPTSGDEGVPLRTVQQPAGTPPPSIAGGALVGHLPPAAAATYVFQDLTGVVGRIDRLGAVFGFGPGDGYGALALLALDGRPAGSGHIHLAITPQRWTAGVLVDERLQEVASDAFTAPLPQDERPLRVDVAYRGDTAVLALPDGTMRTLSDPRFATAGASVAGWEFFRLAPGGADVRFYETWAG
ncbi:hypothetical protein ACR9E3_16385 [Actinomycetospora sp. C-140]